LTEEIFEVFVQKCVWKAGCKSGLLLFLGFTRDASTLRMHSLGSPPRDFKMTDAYQQLLDAAIRGLEDQKARGVRHVAVSAEVLAALARPLASRNHEASVARTAAATTVTTAPTSSRPVAPGSAIKKPVFTRSGARPQPALLVPDPAPAPVLPPLDPTAKAAAFAALREKVLACVKCPHLVASRKSVVFGVGNPDATLMFVGEAPGADEDAQGEPFVGAAGQLLTKIIVAMGLTRQQVYIGNILKCRPDTPGQSSGNRKPTTEEMQTCIPWLHQQIDLIRPKVLVALGATAVEGLLGKTVGITRLRGTWQTYRGIPLMPTYHPAYLLRNQAMTEKRKVWEDMLAVMAKLDLPISDKQQGYFIRTPSA
jgi:uracil-DNA glycosylase family 4